MERILMDPTTNREIRRPPTTTLTAASSSSDTEEDGSSSGGDTSWINNARKKVNAVRPKSQSLVPCTIFRVPQHIRQLEWEAYSPRIISIGPYHHSLLETSAMRQHKWRCVRYLLSRHRSPERASQLLDNCLRELKAIDTKVRCRYSEDFPELKANKLAQLMLLDACFIIHLLLKGAKRGKKRTDGEREEKKEKQKRREVVLEINDQEREDEGEMIAGNEKREVAKRSGLGRPKRVIIGRQSDRKAKKKQVELREPELEIGVEEEEIAGPFVAGLFTDRLVLYDLLMLENQIPFFVIKKLFDKLKTPGDRGIDLPKRALQLFRDIHPHESKSFRTSSMGKIHHLLHLFHSSRVTLQESTREDIDAPEWIPRATELAMAGMKFREKKEADSFLDITFKDGTIEIPSLRVYDYTGPLFRNLMAFEQCYFGTMTSVTIYAVFMDCLIDKAEDARLLHLKDILINRVSSDEAVVALFNQLCNQIYYAADRNYLRDLFVKVNKFYDSKFHRWRAGLKRDYFSNPWTIISVIAAVLLLFLTIEQAVFSGLSYVRPPKGS